MYLLPMTVARLAEESGLSERTIRLGVQHGHLKVIVKEHPMMVDPVDFADWLRNGRRTESKRKRNISQDDQREVAVVHPRKRRDASERDGRDQETGKGKRAGKARKSKPTVFHLDIGGSLEGNGA